MSCLHPSPLPGSWHQMNYLWQEETRCNNQRGNLEDSRGLLLFRGRCPYPLHVNHNTGPVHTDVLKPVLANFNPWPRKLISPGDPGMVDRLEGARISLSVCKEQKRMGGEDHPPLLGCLCLKIVRDESAAHRAHTCKPLPTLPTWAALQGAEHGWEPSSLCSPQHCWAQPGAPTLPCPSLPPPDPITTTQLQCHSSDPLADPALLL